MRLREIEQERKDYHSAAKTKAANKKWTDHQELKKELGLEIAKGRQNKFTLNQRPLVGHGSVELGRHVNDMGHISTVFEDSISAMP